MKLFDLLDQDLFTEMLEERFIRVQRHPIYPLSIYNYTDKTVINHVWNDVTKQCRGLIVNDEGDVLARPFSKFFNYGEKESRTYDENEKVTVTDKMDGSLGIRYPLPDGGYAIATRGSFTSDQATHATKVWNEKYANSWYPLENETVLFEIIYPENRIVVDYDGMDDLVLLGLVDVETGETFSPNALGWDGPKADIFEYVSLSEALAAPDRPGREGFVVHFRESDTRVKLKQEDYLKLHKIVTGLNEHVVWEHIQKDWLVHDLLENLPDEFHKWVLEVAERMFAEFIARENEVLSYFDALEEVGLLADRKGFAIAVKDQPSWLKSALFLMLDYRDFHKVLWKQIEPKKDTFAR